MQCFNGGHIPLGLLSIFILMFGAVLVATVTASHLVVIKVSVVWSCFVIFCFPRNHIIWLIFYGYVVCQVVLALKQTAIGGVVWSWGVDWFC